MIDTSSLLRTLLKTVLAAVVGTGLLILTPIPPGWLQLTLPQFLFAVAVIILLTLGVLALWPRVYAYALVFLVGKVRGLWRGTALEKRVRDQYRRSKETKIKVTRGHGLFIVENGLFHDCIFNRQEGDRKVLKVLLHFPCLESDHLKARAKTNRISREKYVYGVFEVLQEFWVHSNAKRTDEIVFVRFYMSDAAKEWRYYVFKDRHDRATSFFNPYDDKAKGPDSSMLKVCGGMNSICDYLDKTFDRLFEEESVELVESLEDSAELINADRCGHQECEDTIRRMHGEVFMTGGHGHGGAHYETERTADA